MNGPQHYAEAERLLVLADSPAGVSLLADGINCTAQAQVHATLAAAAASVDLAQSLADNLGGGGPLVRLYDGWDAEAKEIKHKASPWAEALA